MRETKPAPGSTLRLDMLRSSAVQRANPTVEIPKDDTAHDVVAALCDGLPSKEEQRFLWRRLAGLIDTVLSALPEQLLERARYATPPLEIPAKIELMNDPAKIIILVNTLHNLVPWDKVAPAHKDSWNLFSEHAGLLVQLCQDMAVGKMSALSPEEYAVKARAMDQLSQSVILFSEGFREAASTIPVPPLPKAPEANRFGSFIRSAKALASLLGNAVVEPIWKYKKAISIGALGAFNACYLALLIWQHPLEAAKLGALVAGVIAAAVAVRVAAPKVGQLLGKIRGWLKNSDGLNIPGYSLGGKAVGWFLTNVVAPISSFFRWCRAKGSDSFSQEKPLSEIVGVNWRLALGKAMSRNGFNAIASSVSIESNRFGFDNSPLVLDVQIPANSSGGLVSLSALRAQAALESPARSTAIGKLFIERVFTDNHPATPPQPGQAFLRFPIVREGLQAVPFPPNCELIGVRVYGYAGNPTPFPSPIKARWSLLGGLEIECPSPLSQCADIEVCFQRRTEPAVDDQTLLQIAHELPHLRNFGGIHSESLRTAISAVTIPHDATHEIVLEHELYRQLNDTSKAAAHDKLISKMIQAAGPATIEMIGGLRAGRYDDLQLYMSARLRNHGAVSALAAIIPVQDGKLKHKEISHHLYTLASGTPKRIDFHDRLGPAQEFQGVKPGLLDSFSLVGAIAKMPADKVFNYASEVGDVLRGRRPLDEVFDKMGGRFLGIFSQKSFANFQGDYGFVSFDPEKRIREAPEHLQPSLRAVSTLATALSFKAFATRAREYGEVQQALTFIDANPAVPKLSPPDQQLISEPFRSHASFNPRAESLALVRGLLDLNARNPEALIDIWRWVGSRLWRSPTPWSQSLCYQDLTDSWHKSRAAGSIGNALTFEDAVTLIEGARVSTAPSDFVLPLLDSMTLLPAMEFGVVGERRSPHGEPSAESLKKLAASIQVMAAHLPKRGLYAFSFEALLHRIAAIGEWGDTVLESEAERKALRSTLVSAVSKLTASMEGEPVVSFFKLIHTDNVAQRERVTRLFEGSDLLKVLGMRGQGARQKRDVLATLGYVIASSLQSSPLSSQSSEMWKNSFECLKRLGLNAAEIPNKVAILTIIKGDLERLKKRDPTFINLPSEETPASRLLAEMTEGQTVRSLQVLNVLVSSGLISAKQLEATWPSCDEGQVARALWDVVRFKSSEKGLLLEVDEQRTKPGKQSSIEVDQLPWLSEIFCKFDRGAMPIIYYNRFRLGDAWADRDLRAVWERFPEHVPNVDSIRSDHMQSLAGGAMMRLFDGFSPEEIYRGHSWLATLMQSERGKAAASRVARLADLLQYNRQTDTVSREIAARACDPQFDEPSCGTVGADLKARMLVAAQLLFSPHRHIFAQRRSNRNRETPFQVLDSRTPSDDTLGARHALTNANGVPERLISPLYAPELPNRKRHAAAVWAALYAHEPSSTIDMKPWVREAQRRAELVRREFRDAWPRYLQSRSGKIIVPTAAGDIRELREYVPGDDYRTIVWPSSHRAGKLIVRTNEETESRGYAFVVDLDYLAQGFYKRKEAADTSDAVKGQGLIDLLTALELVRHDNLSADIVLYGRSYVETIPNAVRRRPGSSTGEFDHEALNTTLAERISSARDLLGAEASIITDLPSPMDRNNPFGSPDRAFDRDKIHVFIASPHHQGAYRHERDVLTNRGTPATAFVPKTANRRGGTR